jgi:ubiquitin C
VLGFKVFFLYNKSNIIGDVFTSRMEIFVRSPSGRMISLIVYPDETLYELKKKLTEKYNLFYDGARMDDNNRTMADYNIKHQSTLDLEEKMQIYVKETVHGLMCTMDVDSSDTIDNLKCKIEATDGFSQEPAVPQSLPTNNRRTSVP